MGQSKVCLAYLTKYKYRILHGTEPRTRIFENKMHQSASIWIGSDIFYMCQSMNYR